MNNLSTRRGDENNLPSLIITDNQTISSNAQNVGLFGGYNWNLGGGYMMGVEGYGNLHNTKDTQERTFAFNDTLSSTLSRRYSAGAAVRLGYHVTPQTLLYGRLGGEVSKFQHHYTERVGDRILEKRRASKHLFAIVPGVGIEQQLGKNWAWRLEYTYAHYNKFTTKFIDSGGATITQQSQPGVHSVRVGLVMKF